MMIPPPSFFLFFVPKKHSNIPEITFLTFEKSYKVALILLHSYHPLNDKKTNTSFCFSSGSNS